MAPTNKSQNAVEATQSTTTEQTTIETVENTSTTRKAPGAAQMRAKRQFTATVVTFALTALLIFMAVFILVTGAEDKNGVVPAAVIVATGAIQFYFGTKNGGTNV